MPSKLLLEVADYCWSKNFLGKTHRTNTTLVVVRITNRALLYTILLFLGLYVDVFRNFFTEHGEVFEDAPPMTAGEHDMKYYSLFQVYLKLYEVCMKLHQNSKSILCLNCLNIICRAHSCRTSTLWTSASKNSTETCETHRMRPTTPT